MSTVKTFCRYCHAYCPMDVEVEDGRVLAVKPDRGNEMYGGYTCVKGRQLVEQMYQAERLLSSQKRQKLLCLVAMVHPLVFNHTEKPFSILTSRCSE